MPASRSRELVDVTETGIAIAAAVISDLPRVEGTYRGPLDDFVNAVLRPYAADSPINTHLPFGDSRYSPQIHSACHLLNASRVVDISADRFSLNRDHPDWGVHQSRISDLHWGRFALLGRNMYPFFR